MESIQQLGVAIEEAWRARDYSDDAFAEIATGAIERAEIHRRVRPQEILEWTLATPQLPRQADPGAKFGQPPLTLFAGRRFYIDALFWIDGTTTVHQHSFSGAFQVLEGSSLHTEYAFETARAVSTSLRVGTLTSKGSQLLRAGDVRPIHAGARFIHSLFHLDRPSVTLVARTVRDARERLQYDYLQPGVAIDPFLEEEWSDRIVQVLEHLRRLANPRYETLAGDLVATADAHTAFLVLRAARNGADRKLFERLLDRARSRHGEIVDAFAAAFEELKRRELLVHKRGAVHDPGHRFFLALLLNAPARLDLLRLTKAYAPADDPIETIVRWIEELSKVAMKLQFAGAPWEPNVLGLPAIDDAHRAVLRALLRGERVEDAGDGAATSFARMLGDSLVFRPLFK